jgi:hypothetical protein
MIVDLDAERVGRIAAIFGPKFVQRKPHPVKRNHRSCHDADRKVFRIQESAASMKNGSNMSTNIKWRSDVPRFSEVKY